MLTFDPRKIAKVPPSEHKAYCMIAKTCTGVVIRILGLKLKPFVQLICRSSMHYRDTIKVYERTSHVCLLAIIHTKLQAMSIKYSSQGQIQEFWKGGNK